MGIVWDPDLSIGVHEIDLQHQELFRQVDQLLQAMERGKGREVIAKLLAFLSQYVAEHFHAEQELMIRHGYPNYRHHKTQHDDFVSGLLELLDEFERTGPTISLTLKVNRLVYPWLRLHIGTFDRAIGEFLGTRRMAQASR